MKLIKTLLSTLLIGNLAFAQEIPSEYKNEIYLGIGMGLEYGGIGGKIEYKPIENISIFGGIGYNLLNLGWNLGTSYNINISERVALNPTVMYGYNGVTKVTGAPRYDMTSYGVSLGLNLDLKSRSNIGKWNFGLYFPIRSEKFMDNYDEIKNNPYIDMKNKLLPFTYSVGYSFKIN